MAGNLVAANLPDIDVLYTGLLPAPLGYLLHHRGYTHTVAGVLGLGLILGLLLRASPAARRLASTHPLRLWLPLALNLLGHVSLDAFNTYGVHPFYPFNARWYYGDAVFIFEPWIWILLAAAAIRNATRRRTQLLVVGLVAALIVAVGALGIVPIATAGLLAIAGAALVAVPGRIRPRVRSAVALSASVLFMFAMLAASRAARAETVRAIQQDRRGEIVDVVLSPDPAVPVCWTVVAIEENEAADEIVLRRGTVSLLPAWHPQSACVSRRFTAGPAPGAASDALGWSEEIRESLARLRTLNRTNCRVHGWLQFGRAPVIRDDRILDLRFETGARGNFTAMSLVRGGDGEGCPAYVPPWEPPRADLLNGRR